MPHTSKGRRSPSPENATSPASKSDLSLTVQAFPIFGSTQFWLIPLPLETQHYLGSGGIVVTSRQGELTSATLVSRLPTKDAP